MDYQQIYWYLTNLAWSRAKFQFDVKFFRKVLVFAIPSNNIQISTVNIFEAQTNLEYSRLDKKKINCFNSTVEWKLQKDMDESTNTLVTVSSWLYHQSIQILLLKFNLFPIKS